MSILNIHTNVVLASSAITAIVVLIVIIFIRNYQYNQENQAYESTLNQSWKYYKNKYIQYDGRVIDNSTMNSQTTSEGQSYAMMRSVILGDKTTFEKTSKWSINNLQRSDKLFSWDWGKNTDGSYGILSEVGGTNSATDADEDIAASFIAAYYKWNQLAYLNTAKSIVHSIYSNDSTTLNNKRYIVGGNWANDSSQDAKIVIFTDPSYLKISDYRLFYKIDPSDNWGQIINTSYQILNTCTFNNFNKLNIPPDWCIINKSNFTVITDYSNTPPQYSYDAFRVMYNIALDYKQYKDTRDIKYLTYSSSYLNAQYKNKTSQETYNVTNGSFTYTGSLAIPVGMISNFYYTNIKAAKDLYNNKLLPYFNKNTGQFGNNYYDSNWVWFSTYLFSSLSLNNLSNI